MQRTRTATRNQEFRAYKSETRIVIRDLYLNAKSRQIMLEKLDECNTITNISNLLAWGRVNLL